MVSPVPGDPCITVDIKTGALMVNTSDLIIVLLLGIALFLLVLPESRRWISIFFGIAMGLVFILNIQGHTVIYSLIKLVTATVAVVILNISPIETGPKFFTGIKTSRVFRIFTLILGFVFVVFIASGVSDFFSLDIALTSSALLLIACGFVQIGTSVHTFRIVLGLLVLLQGFEILYGNIESSIFVNGLVSLIDLLIALVGSYLLNQSAEEIAG